MSDDAIPRSRRGFVERYGVALLFPDPPSQRTLGTLGPLESVEHDELAPSLQQSWWWRDAAETVRRCRVALLIEDDGSALPHLERYAKFQEMLADVVVELEPAALHWIPTQQFIHPANFLEAVDEVGLEYPALGALNVRLYRITGGETMLMDTLGLGALGLWDLQCHFKGLPPDRIATWLLETARAEFLSGQRPLDEVIAPDGATRWPVRAEDALMAPERVLLDVNPGSRFTAGERL